jgi:hypothetical protein
LAPLVTLCSIDPRSGGRPGSPARQYRVNAGYRGVKTPSGVVAPGGGGRRLISIAVAVGVTASWRERRAMADLAYALLVIGVFGVLALVLRGLERL